MTIRLFKLIALLGAFALAAAPLAWAEDDDAPAPKNEPADRDEPAPKPADDDDAAAPKASAGEIVFGDGAARFRMQHDVSTGRATFTLADPNVKITQAPTVILNTDAGPKEVNLVAAPGQPGTWVLTHDVLRTARFDGTMRILVDGKTLTAPLVTTAVPASGVGTTIVARHGGRVIAFPDCRANVEVVQDPATGTLTIYSLQDVKIVDAPTITVTEKTGPTTVKVMAVDGQPGVWKVTHTAFKTKTSVGRIKLLVDGKPCEASLRGGQLVTVTDGPSFEVVPDPATKSWTFYAVDETLRGRPYTIENPQVIVTTAEGPRTVQLVPVEGEPRAWRLAGLDASASRPMDARLQFTLFGKTLDTRVGLSGIGAAIR